MNNIHFNNYQKYFDAYSNYQKEKQIYELRVAKRHGEYWRSLSGTAFEKELGKLFSLMGYSVDYTPSTSDGGVDLCLRKDGKLTIVQCKAHNKRIPISVARELCASIVDFRANDAIIACFEGVTKPVEVYIANKPITVLHLGDIIALQNQHG